MGKPLIIEKEVHKELTLFKTVNEFRTFSDAIEYLLSVDNNKTKEDKIIIE